MKEGACAPDVQGLAAKGRQAAGAAEAGGRPVATYYVVEHLSTRSDKEMKTYKEIKSENSV